MNRNNISRHRTLFPELATLELCAGAGGQALGFEQAGIEHVGLLEKDATACSTLRLNRPEWNIIEEDLSEFNGGPYKGVDMISAGLPCPPFSVAGKQLGKMAGDRDLSSILGFDPLEALRKLLQRE